MANVGRKATPETKLKQSEAMKGRNPWDYQTSETKDKISKALTGRTIPEEVKKKMSDAKKGKIPNNARVVIIDGVEYESVKAASNALNIPYKSLLRKLKNVELLTYQYKIPQ